MTGRVLNETSAFFPGKNRALTMALLLLALLLPSAPGQAADLQQCSRCHQAKLETDLLRMYLHAPFMKQRCAACHLESELAPDAAPEQAVAQPRITPAEQEKIQWLGESMEPNTSHWFMVPAARLADLLLVEIRGSGGPLALRELTVPPPAAMTLVEDSGRPPVISGVRVLEVRRGLFLSATIAWETETVTDARVRYGRNELNQSSPRGRRLSRNHQEVLHDLEPGRTYRYAAVATDLFQRESTSEPLTFSTARPLAAPPPQSSPGGTVWQEVDLQHRFQRLGDDYLLELTTDQPVALSLGAREGSPARLETTLSSGGETVPDDAHAGLTSKIATSIQACQSCHQRGKAGASHPVNVYPRRGMVIPPEYPTLPDGRITCSSCHEHHGSNRNYRLIKDGQRELCLGCHRDMR